MRFIQTITAAFCTLLASTALIAADPCLLPMTCPTTSPDEQIGPKVPVGTTAGGNGVVIINDGSNFIRTNIPYRNGLSNPSAVRVTYYSVFCTENASNNAIGATVVSPGRGNLAGDGLCGKKKRTKKVKYEVTFTPATGPNQTQPYDGPNEGQEEPSNDGCGVQTISTTKTCGGGL